MLTRIQIKNFALIKAIDCPISSGLTLLTGETGAGKSLLINALALALGGRWQTRWLHAAGQSCHITLHFSLNSSPATVDWLAANNFPCADKKIVVIERQITPDGRSRSFINKHACSLHNLRELAPCLVSIHGQHKQQLLLKPDHQLFLFDVFAQTLPLRETVSQLYHRWYKTTQEVMRLRELIEQRDDRLQLLQYHLEELDTLALQPNEWEQLNQEHKKLTCADELMQQCHQTLDRLGEHENNAALASLHACEQSISEAARLMPALNNTVQLIQQAHIYAQEAYAELQAHANAFEPDPERLQWVEQRLSSIHNLARKHKISPDELATKQDALRAEFAELTAVADKNKTLQEELDALALAYQKDSALLTKKRHAALAQFNALVTQHMSTLGMPHGLFEARLTTNPDNAFSAHGAERLTFYVTTNAGRKPQPLNKVASGGELSRISLIIQTVTQQQNNVPTLVFDEVDVGISGGIAETVGKLLRQLGDTAQVLCITHLAQIAAQGHHHLCVNKETTAQKTAVTLHALTAKQRVAELARLLGGLKITAETLQHAEKMLALV